MPRGPQTPALAPDHCDGLNAKDCSSFKAKKFFGCQFVDDNCVGSKTDFDFLFNGCTGPCCGLPRFVCKGNGGVLSRAWEKGNQVGDIKQACKFERVGMSGCFPRD